MCPMAYYLHLQGTHILMMCSWGHFNIIWYIYSGQEDVLQNDKTITISLESIVTESRRVDIALVQDSECVLLFPHVKANSFAPLYLFILKIIHHINWYSCINSQKSKVSKSVMIYHISSDWSYNCIRFTVIYYHRHNVYTYFFHICHKDE